MPDATGAVLDRLVVDDALDVLSDDQRKLLRMAFSGWAHVRGDRRTHRDPAGHGQDPRPLRHGPARARACSGVIDGRITTELVIDRYGKVGSRQVVMLAHGVVTGDESGARQLGRSYWIAVEKSTHGLVRRVRRREGGNDLCLLGRGPALLLGWDPRSSQSAAAA